MKIYQPTDEINCIFHEHAVIWRESAPIAPHQNFPIGSCPVCLYVPFYLLLQNKLVLFFFLHRAWLPCVLPQRMHSVTQQDHMRNMFFILHSQLSVFIASIHKVKKRFLRGIHHTLHSYTALHLKLLLPHQCKQKVLYRPTALIYWRLGGAPEINLVIC